MIIQRHCTLISKGIVIQHHYTRYDNPRTLSTDIRKYDNPRSIVNGISQRFWGIYNFKFEGNTLPWRRALTEKYCTEGDTALRFQLLSHLVQNTCIRADTLLGL